MSVKQKIREALTDMRLLPILEKITSEELKHSVDGYGRISYSNQLGILKHNIPKLQSLWKEVEDSKRYEPKVRSIVSLSQSIVNYQNSQDKRPLVKGLLEQLKSEVRKLVTQKLE